MNLTECFSFFSEYVLYGLLFGTIPFIIGFLINFVYKLFMK